MRGGEGGTLKSGERSHSVRVGREVRVRVSKGLYGVAPAAIGLGKGDTFRGARGDASESMIVDSFQIEAIPRSVRLGRPGVAAPSVGVRALFGERAGVGAAAEGRDWAPEARREYARQSGVAAGVSQWPGHSRCHPVRRRKSGCPCTSVC